MRGSPPPRQRIHRRDHAKHRSRASRPDTRPSNRRRGRAGRIAVRRRGADRLWRLLWCQFWRVADAARGSAFCTAGFPHPSLCHAAVRHHETSERDEQSERTRVVSSEIPSSRPAVCVRLCDGRYFLLPRSTTNQANALCAAACPHAATSVFRTDRELKDATDADGKTYSALPNAFAYRSRVMPGCSCRAGKPGLATVAVEKDPTLEQGDIVVTQHGQLVFQGKSGEEQHGAFAPR